MSASAAIIMHMMVRVAAAREERACLAQLFRQRP
jgi:hypothetical protein